MRIEGGAVVDEPWLPLPDEQVRIARGPVGVRGEGIEPHDARRKIGGHERTRRRQGEVERAVEGADADIDAVAPAQQVLDLRIRLAAPEAGRYVHKREIRRGQAEA